MRLFQGTVTEYTWSDRKIPRTTNWNSKSPALDSNLSNMKQECPSPVRGVWHKLTLTNHRSSVERCFVFGWYLVWISASTDKPAWECLLSCRQVPVWYLTKSTGAVVLLTSFNLLYTFSVVLRGRPHGLGSGPHFGEGADNLDRRNKKPRRLKNTLNYWTWWNK